MTFFWRQVCGVVGAVLLVASIGSTQNVTTGSIAGTVKDATGAVLPGVTVEAASPALIEKVRTVVTDERGNYKIIDLRPGTYSVSFSLPGFSVVKREGIELTTGFTANASAELKVGSLQETVTVTGASPVVDVQNVRAQTVISREVLDTVPSGKGPQALASLTLGARGGQATGASLAADVGGTSQTNSQSISVHGSHSADLQYQLDGMSYNTSHLGGGVGYYYVLNPVGVQEVGIQTDGFNAEAPTLGAQVNAVPRDGGNALSFYGNAAYASEKMASKNVTPELQARGVAQQPGTREVYDYGVGVGGPLKKDRLWFYSANRWNASYRYNIGSYLNTSSNPLFYAPGQATYSGQPIHDNGIRMTWQASPRQKITASENYQDQHFRTWGYGSAAPAGTIATSTPTTENRWGPLHVAQGTWSHPRTNRLLFEAGGSLGYFTRDVNPGPYVVANTISVRDQNTGLTYGSGTDYWQHRTAHNVNERASASYVTGSHAMKAGLQLQQGIQDDGSSVYQDISYTFRGTTPISLTEFAPRAWNYRYHQMGLYAQDQWSVKHLTLSYGLRLDRLYGFTLDRDIAAGRFIAARHFDAVQDAPNWDDLSPRVGVAYDLFGNGKTALKGSWARGVANGNGGNSMQSRLHPANSTVNNATRTWNDTAFPVGDPRRGNFVPDCDFTNRAANGECGVISDAAFGTVRTTTRYADDVRKGFGVRDNSTRWSMAVQHEIRRGIGLNVGYYGAAYGNLTISENVAVTPGDFTSYCVTAPADSRLPGGGGNRICGFQEISIAKFGQVDTLVSPVSKYGDTTQTIHSIDVSLSARLPRRGIVQGGISTGTATYDGCFALDKPNVTAFVENILGSGMAAIENRPSTCRVTQPWSSITQVKVFAAYPIGWGVEASGNYQNMPGIVDAAALSLTGAQLAQASVSTLGRAGSSATYSVQLVDPYTMFEARLSQLDLRFSKSVKVHGARVKGMFDIYNAFNANTILGTSTVYGSTWLRATSILSPRLFKVGAEVTF